MRACKSSRSSRWIRSNHSSGLVADLLLAVAEHRFPARREGDPLRLQIPVPQAVVNGAGDQVEDLLGFARSRFGGPLPAVRRSATANSGRPHRGSRRIQTSACSGRAIRRRGIRQRPGVDGIGLDPGRADPAALFRTGGEREIRRPGRGCGCPDSASRSSPKIAWVAALQLWMRPRSSKVKHGVRADVQQGVQTVVGVRWREGCGGASGPRPGWRHRKR